MPVSIVAALQIGSLPGGKDETLAQILAYEDEISRSGAQLVVMPEALLGGYPKGEGFVMTPSKGGCPFSRQPRS